MAAQRAATQPEASDVAQGRDRSSRRSTLRGHSSGARPPIFYLRNEHVLYCMAATAARAGDNATALKSLRQAVGAGPANRAQARQDPDFDTLREDEEFLSILYPQAS